MKSKWVKSITELADNLKSCSKDDIFLTTYETVENGKLWFHLSTPQITTDYYICMDDLPFKAELYKRRFDVGWNYEHMTTGWVIKLPKPLGDYSSEYKGKEGVKEYLKVIKLDLYYALNDDIKEYKNRKDYFSIEDEELIFEDESTKIKIRLETVEKTGEEIIWIFKENKELDEDDDGFIEYKEYNNRRDVYNYIKEIKEIIRK